MYLFLRVGVLLYLFAQFGNESSYAETTQCLERPERWSATEQWIWSQVCEGKSADLVMFTGGERSISGSFLTQIVDEKRFADQISRVGIHIKNTTITGKFDLSNASIKFILFFEDCRFDDEVNFDAVTTTHDIIFHKTSFLKPISFRFVKSGRSIYFGNVDVEKFQVPLPVLEPRPVLSDVDLSRSQFEGDVIFGNVRINGSVTGRYLRTGSSLIFNRCTVNDLNLSQAVTKNQLMIVDCDVNPVKPMAQAPFSVNLYSSQIGQALHLNRSTFTRPFYAENVTIHGPLQAQKAKFSDLIVAGASIDAAIDLGSTSGVDQKLWTHSIWQHPSTLNVRGAKATSIIAARDSTVWPEEIGLDGFLYSYIGRQPFGATTSEELPAEWYINLLAQDRRYSPQPYEQLAKVLRESGNFVQANQVLYAGRDRQLSIAIKNGEWLYATWYFLFKVFIGYGYRIWYAIFWVVGFVTVGALIFRRTPEAKAEGMPYGIAFSFDRLLPLVKLRERHYKIDLMGWPRYYFYFHQLMGYVLGSFLLAGLSGLTK
jgi:hypothetical protein